MKVVKSDQCLTRSSCVVTQHTAEISKLFNFMDFVRSRDRNIGGGNHIYFVYLCSDLKGIVFGILVPFNGMLFIVYCPF